MNKILVCFSLSNCLDYASGENMLGGAIIAMFELKFCPCSSPIISNENKSKTKISCNRHGILLCTNSPIHDFSIV